MYHSSTGDLYVKSDVYGFGVVLLEMLTSLRALDTKRPSGQQHLVDWLKPSVSSKRKLKSIMDIRMEGQYSTKPALQAGQLTLKCLESDPKIWPAMTEVVEELEGLEAMKEKPKDCKTKSTHSTPHHHSQHPIHHRAMLLKFDQNIKFHTKQGEEKYFTHKKIVRASFFFFFLDGEPRQIWFYFIFIFFWPK